MSYVSKAQETPYGKLKNRYDQPEKSHIIPMQLIAFIGAVEQRSRCHRLQCRNEHEPSQIYINDGIDYFCSI